MSVVNSNNLSPYQSLVFIGRGGDWSIKLFVDLAGDLAGDVAVVSVLSINNLFQLRWVNRGEGFRHLPLFFHPSTLSKPDS